MLQLYAAKALYQASSPPSPVDQVISAGEEQWEQVIKHLLQSDAITENGFLEDLQKRMEGTVLGQSSGSYAQRVQVSCVVQLYLLLAYGVNSSEAVCFLIQLASFVWLYQDLASVIVLLILGLTFGV